MKTYTKIDEEVLEVTKQEVAPAPVVTTFKRDFIENQILEITKQRDEMIALKEKELLECQNILAEMDKLGIITKVEPVEPLPVDEPIVK